jgi:hypothetical protein
VDHDLLLGESKIFINRRYICHELPETVKCMILHELGHVALYEDHFRLAKCNFGIGLKLVPRVSRSRREYEAQLWAIRRAKELGMHKIYRRAKRALLEDWNRWEWNGIYRPYRLAAKIAHAEGAE